MAAAVTLSASFFDDARFEYAAQLLGMDPERLRMQMIRIWSWQTERHTPESPAHVVPEALVIGRLGPEGPDALVRAELAERRPGGIYMRGTEGEIEWLGDMRAQRKAAGRARAAKAGRSVDGRWRSAGAPLGSERSSPAASHTDVQRATSETPASDQRDSSERPARLQHQDQDQDQDQISEISLSPRAIGAPPAQRRPPGNELVEHAKQRLRAARAELDPSAPSLPAFAGEAETELLRRLAQHPPAERRAALDHALDVAIRLAREQGSVGRLYLGGISTQAAWGMLSAQPKTAPARASPRRGQQRHTAADEIAALIPTLEPQE